MKTKMNIRKILKKCLIFSLFYSFTGMVFSADEKPYCELAEVQYKKQVRINNYPSFFFKVHPSGDHIGYISITGNQLLDLKTGESFPLPGFIDPTFTADGEHLIIPIVKKQLKGYIVPGARLSNTEEESNEDYKTNLAFYPFEDFKKAAVKNDQSKKVLDNLHSKPASVDYDNNGVYQSATTSKNGEFNLLTDQNGLSVTTYKKTDKGVVPLSKPDKMCSKLGDLQTDTPMLSKDGNFLSILNKVTNTSQIYEIKKDGNCSLSLDLGIATGKISFNKDSSQVTFHVDKFRKKFGSYFSGVSSDITKDVFVLNLDQDKGKEDTKLIPTTWAKVTNTINKGNGSYYPDFSEKGDIFFLRDENNFFEFVQAEQRNLNFSPYLSSLDAEDMIIKKDSGDIPCLKVGDKLQPLYLLGQLWSKSCQSLNDASFADTMMTSMNLDGENCEELVRKEWNAKFVASLKESLGSSVQIDFINKVKLEDLIAACPKSKNGKVEKNIVGKWNKKDHATFNNVLTQKCISCHSRELTYTKDVNTRVYLDENGKTVKKETKRKELKLDKFDPNNIDYKLASKMLAAIANKDPKYRMPKTGSLSDEEKLLFLKVVEEKQYQQKGDVVPEFSDVDYAYMYSEKAIVKEYEKYVEENKDGFSKLDPEARANTLSFYKNYYWCTMGQIGCKDLVSKMLSDKKTTLETGNVSQDGIKETLKNYEAELRCTYKLEDYDVCKKQETEETSAVN